MYDGKRHTIYGRRRRFKMLFGRPETV